MPMAMRPPRQGLQHQLLRARLLPRHVRPNQAARAVLLQQRGNNGSSVQRVCPTFLPPGGVFFSRDNSHRIAVRIKPVTMADCLMIAFQ